MNFIDNSNINKGIRFLVLFFLISETVYAQETKALVTATAVANDNI
jgi:penicillin-binding protein-related factor A (putative recombinase)